MTNTLQDRRQEQRLLAEGHAKQEREARHKATLDCVAQIVRSKSYGEFGLSPLLRKAG